ncbi:MAG: hypothetical protein WCK57_07655 [Verrucomicrobiae bacterium]
MSKIQDIIWGMVEENQSAAAISENLSKAGWEHQEATTNWNKLRDTYAKPLRSYVKRRTEKIVTKHSQSWGTQVEVFPLHNHVTRTTAPLVTVKWSGKHGVIELTCWAITPERVERFLERFEAVVIGTQLHQERITI